MAVGNYNGKKGQRVPPHVISSQQINNGEARSNEFRKLFYMHYGG